MGQILYVDVCNGAHRTAGVTLDQRRKKTPITIDPHTEAHEKIIITDIKEIQMTFLHLLLSV